MVAESIFLIILLIAAREAPDFWQWWFILFSSDIFNIVLYIFTWKGFVIEYIKAVNAVVEAKGGWCVNMNGAMYFAEYPIKYSCPEHMPGYHKLL